MIRARGWLKPFAQIFLWVVQLRQVFYKRGWLKTYRLPKPVISVGNLTVGGTGKTPLSIYLLEQLIKSGLHPALVSRGYGAKLSDVRKVHFDVRKDDLAREFGDEPTLIAQTCPRIPVWVGVPRWQACERAIADGGNILVLDDAFQHWAVQRDLDIVILDATEDLKNYDLLPLGRARESWSALQRAGLIVLSKVNLACPDVLQSLRSRLQAEQMAGRIHASVVEMSYQITRLRHLVSGEEISLAELAGQRVLLVSGIGRPASFAQAIELVSEPEIVEHLIFPDHHRYCAEDIKKIRETKARLSAQRIIVTEKDSVKLAGFVELSSEIWVANLQLTPVKNRGAFDEALAVFSKGH